MLTSYSDVNCMVSNIKHSHPDEDIQAARVWSLSFKPDQEIGFLFPYINGARDDALWYEHPEHVKFLFEDYRCVLYPDLVAAYFFETRETAFAFIRRLMDFLSSLDARKENIQPNFNKIQQVSVMDILRLLPGTNCRECGFPTCMAFAAVVTMGKAMAEQCPGLVSPMSENAVYPVLDGQGKLVHSVSLKIDTAGLKRRIQDQNDQIRLLETQLNPLTGNDDVQTTSMKSSESRGLNLTGREVEVLTLIAQGDTNNEIGNHLFISPHTVKSHMINIFNKLTVSDRTQAAVLGVRSGLI